MKGNALLAIKHGVQGQFMGRVSNGIVVASAIEHGRRAGNDRSCAPRSSFTVTTFASVALPSVSIITVLPRFSIDPFVGEPVDLLSKLLLDSG